jgi:hypothetical protein
VIRHPYYQQLFSIATMHRKETVIRPLIESSFSAKITVPDINTDSLGTFCGKNKRRSSPLETAIQKARLGMKADNSLLCISNEGSFITDPLFGLGIINHEIMVLVDDINGIIIKDELLSRQTNYSRTIINSQNLDSNAIIAFMKNGLIGSHGAIAYIENMQDEKAMIKDIVSYQDILTAINHLKNLYKVELIVLETDMRAHKNPTRMDIINSLAQKLIERMKKRCNLCKLPGFGLKKSIYGLPCRWCKSSTDSLKEELYGCAGCDYSELRLPEKNPRYFAEPVECANCNP